MANSEFEEKVANYNESQRSAFHCVCEYAMTRHQHHMGEFESSPEPRKVFITGGAGTGKNYVINVIQCT